MVAHRGAKAGKSKLVN